MKKVKLIISILVFILSFSTYSQDVNPDKVLGFACGGAGSSTKPVSNMYNYLVEKKYDKIVKLLYSKNAAEKFLAIVICEKLAKKKKLKLTEKELKIIKNSYQSNEFVHVCGGCTYEDKLKMSIMLNVKDDVEHVRKETEEYFEDVL